MAEGGRIPVILDTDIGSDIDDTWALAMLLKSPELDVKLIVSDRDDTVYRAKLIGRMLEIAERTDLPIGVGMHRDNVYTRPRQAPWVEDYNLSRYPGTVYEDGVEALIQTIMQSPESLTLICVGPLPNIAAALEREPGIAERTRFVGMHGCIRHSRKEERAMPESNVKNDIAACQKVFAAPWQEMVITPLDTCSFVTLQGDRYQKLRGANDPVMQAVMENYRIWAGDPKAPHDPDTASSVLFDTVAVYLAFTTEHLVMERMGVRVTDEGLTVADLSARKMDVATDWRDLDAYEAFLVERLLGSVTR